MKRLLASIIAFVLVVGLLPAYTSAPLTQAELAAVTSQADTAASYSFDSAGVQTGLDNVQVSAESLGIGGGGALFAPAISPHDSDTFITGCDMGGVYVTHDAGGKWERHELTGQTMYAVAFDPSRAGYVYAGSSGLARSSDNGDTWELLWPKPASILADPSTYEGLRHNYYNTGTWLATASVKAIAVDPADFTHLYVLVSGYLKAYNWNLGWELFESTDDGATFTSMGVAPNEKRGIESGFDDPRLLVLGGEPYVFVQTGIFRPGNGAELECVYDPDGSADAGGVARYSVVSADLMADGRVAVAEALDAVPASGTYRPRTSLRLFSLQQDGTLVLDEDLTDELGVPTDDFSLMCDRHKGGAFSVSISHVRASGKRLYFVNVSTQAGYSGTIFLLGMCDLEKAAGSHMRWVFGFPLWDNFWKNDSRPFDEYDVVDRGHSDTFYQQYGVAVDPHNPKAFLLDTAGGCFYSDDCDFRRDSGGNWPSNRSNIRQLYTESPADGEYVTTGIDEQTTYGLRQDPFDANHLAMLYTDVGLWMSGNGGASWHKGDSSGVTSGNMYDLVFDRHVRGLAFSAWSAQHDAPYQKDFATTGARGGVARSTDGGVTWTKVGTGLPNALVPVRLAVVYPTGEEQRQAGTNRTIWLATFGKGFWRSDDGGQTFVEVNGGISKTGDGLVLGNDIVASADGSHVFALTVRGSSAQGKSAGGSHGRVYEWNATAGEWRALAWPEGADVEAPKTLCWDEERSTLYVSCIAAFDRVMGGKVDYVNFGGGLFSYRPGTDAALVAVDAESPVVGATSNIEGCAVDSAGNLFASDMRGSVFLRRAGESDFVKLYDGFHLVSKDVQLVSETRGAYGAIDDVLALPTFGGGLLRLQVHMTTSSETCEHVWDSGEVTVQPTCTKPGERTFTCTVCGATRTEAVAALGHDWGEWVVTKPATCVVPGTEQRTCKHDATHVEEREVAAIGHDWGEPTYTWASDLSGVTARVVCKHDASHAIERTVSTTYQVTKTPTATEKGEGTYTAAFSEAPFATQVRTVEILATGGEDENTGGGENGSGETGGGDANTGGGTGTGTESGGDAGSGGTRTGGGDAESDGAHTGGDAGSGGTESGDGTNAGGGDAGSDGAHTGGGDAGSASGTTNPAKPAAEPSTGDTEANPTKASPTASTVVTLRPVFRLANPKTGQRRYAPSSATVSKLVRARWSFEGITFYSPAEGGKPVWQLKKSGRFTYTAKPAEVAKLQKQGWGSKRVAFRSLAKGGVKVYRLRNKATGAYLLTKSKSEVRSLKRQGWKSQGVALRAAK